ncbi:MAG: hypothetical protein QGI83_02885 [Candidatus Latescibacteria bacterium]|nr:hypothetical protein [Candidatus Latescibacterota bacterium]
MRAGVVRASVSRPDALAGLVQGSVTPRAMLELVMARSLLAPSRGGRIEQASRYDPEIERRLGAEFTPEGLARVGLCSEVSQDLVGRLLGSSAPTAKRFLELSVASSVGGSIDRASAPAASTVAAIRAATTGGEATLRLRGRASSGSYDLVLGRSKASDAQIRLMQQLSFD